MTAEQKELYFYTKSQFETELSRISKDCSSPIIAVRQVVNKAIKQYKHDYCNINDNPFTPEDFTIVSNKFYLEIMED